MRYYVSLSERPEREPVVVDLVDLPDGSLEAAVGGRPVAVDVAAAGPRLSVRVDGTVVDVTFDGPDRRPVAVGPTGGRTSGQVETECERSAKSTDASR